MGGKDGANGAEQDNDSGLENLGRKPRYCNDWGKGVLCDVSASTSPVKSSLAHGGGFAWGGGGCGGGLRSSSRHLVNVCR